MPPPLNRTGQKAVNPSEPPSITALTHHWRGRGARSNETGRFESRTRAFVDDGWENLENIPKWKTELFEERPKAIISRNKSPDISFEQSINPYQGCEHGCIYCYARPSHAYFGLSPGLDFESKIFIKPNAAALLREELTATSYTPRTIMIGANTDPYQPAERACRITRQILEVMSEFNHPVGLITKSALVMRDIDILSSLAERGLVKVALSITSLDPKLARAMEPRASTPAKRLEALRALSSAGVPSVAMMGPVIPAINDMEIEKLLTAVAEAGAREAGYIMLRLPLEVRDLFQEWLETEFPERAAKVLSLVRETRGGKLYTPEFGLRMKGSGVYAWQTGRRFQMMAERLGLNREKVGTGTFLFWRPPKPGQQLQLI